jgi:hypothetical protein
MECCCICGKDLPNKYAVAGSCAAAGCAARFCALHWRGGNRRCPAHGWEGDAPSGPSDFRAGLATPEGGSPAVAAPEEKPAMPVTDPAAPAAATPQPPATESGIREWARKHLTAEQAKKVMAATIQFAGKAGKAAAALVARLRNERSPDDMLKAIDESLAANQAKSKPLTEKSERLYQEIAKKKKTYEAAPPARKKLLELELRNLMAEYKGVERELTAFYDNEHALNVVRGRLLELMAHGMRKLDEGLVDTLADDIEEAVEDAEGVRDAVRDLDKAGKRRERESDQESFAEALAGFDAAAGEKPAEAPETPATAPTLPTTPAKAAPARTAEPPEGAP